MKNGTSSYARPEPRKLFETLQFQEALAYAEEHQQKIFVSWLEADEISFRGTLRYESTLLDEVSDYLRRDEPSYAAFRIGSLMGTVESFERIIYEQGQTQWAQARLQKEAYQVKHLPEIVQALETHGVMTHAELSKCLGIKLSTLSEAMKKVLETGAVQASISGKYKIYTLTDSGLRYGRELRKRKWGGSPQDEAVQTLQDYFKNVNDEAELRAVRDRLRSMLAEGPSVEVYPDDTMWLYYHSPIDGNIISQNFRPQCVSRTDKRPHAISMGGVMGKPVIISNKKRRPNRVTSNSNFMQAAEG